LQFCKRNTGAKIAVIQAVHTKVKGRARYKVTELYNSPEVKTYLERSLLNYPEITFVSANPLTSKILVHFPKGKSYQDIAAIIESILLTFKKKSNLVTENKSKKPSKSNKLAVTNSQEQTQEDWYLLPADKVIHKLDTSQTLGLSGELAAANLDKYGLNVLSQTETRSNLSIIVEQFKSLPVALLGVAAVVSVLTGGVIEAAVILCVVFIKETNC
jgi:P-type Ca2+ transporter type 2C